MNLFVSYIYISDPKERAIGWRGRGESGHHQHGQTQSQEVHQVQGEQMQIERGKIGDIWGNFVKIGGRGDKAMKLFVFF